MFGKGSKLYSILRMKCPRCHEGDLFTQANPYNLKKLGNMHSHCQKCGEPFSPEPGFYFGATYVSYALTVAVGVAVFVASYVLFGTTSRELIWVIGGVITVLAPILFLLSRSIWINFFVSYDPDAIARHEREAEMREEEDA